MKTSFRGYRERSDTVDLWVSIIPALLWAAVVIFLICCAPSVDVLVFGK